MAKWVCSFEGALLVVLLLQVQSTSFVFVEVCRTQVLICLMLTGKPHRDKPKAVPHGRFVSRLGGGDSEI